jgi:zinc/manganese transport system substrate-binding protein
LNAEACRYNAGLFFNRVDAMFSLVKFDCFGLGTRIFLAASLMLILFTGHASASNELIENNAQPLRVVTTFSVLADMVREIGGVNVDVETLVNWDEDAHVFQPSPDDVKKIASANLLVLNGLGFEGWLARLLLAAEYKGPSVEASKGINLIYLSLNHNDHNSHDEDDDHDHHSHSASVYDPHAWHSLKAAMVYVDNIAKALVKSDPKNASAYLENLKVYSEKLQALDVSITQEVASVPVEKRRLVVPHNAFAYLARDYNLQIHSLQGLSTDSEASAADLAKIVRLIRTLKINAIFTETISDKRLIRVVEAETEATIEGALVSGALSKKLAPTYLDMMKYNSDLIINALTKN